MKLTSVTPIVLSVPFDAGGVGEGLMPTTWNTLDFCLVRIETDQGLVGWGEGFGYFCSQSVAAIIQRSIAPLLVGRELENPRVLSEEIQHKLVLHVGGSELQLVGPTDARGYSRIPHSPYFGPGYLATLQMAVVAPDIELFEDLYVRPEAWLYVGMPQPEQGRISIPSSPGLGIEPNLDVLDSYCTG